MHVPIGSFQEHESGDYIFAIEPPLTVLKGVTCVLQQQGTSNLPTSHVTLKAMAVQPVLDHSCVCNPDYQWSESAGACVCEWAGWLRGRPTGWLF